MRFKPGQHVYLKETGEWGEIVEFCDENSCFVDVDGDEIPVYFDDLALADEAGDIIRQKEFETKYHQEEPEGDSDSFNPTTLHPNENGLFLVFRRKSMKEKKYPDFRIFLVNRHPTILTGSFKLECPGVEAAGINIHLKQDNWVEITSLSWYYINDRPSFRFELKQEFALQGTQENIDFELKTKPVKLAGILNPLLTDPGLTAVLPVLTQLPKKKASPLQKKKRIIYTEEVVPIDIYKVKAHVADTIDLHIEKLHADHGELSNSDILQIQMESFRKFLDEAYRAGLHKIYVIHGLGKGRLKNEIHKDLRNNPIVIKYINEYHPRYGFGATEIDL